MITHLESDIPECEVKWALESITMNKASGGDGIPAELFQILKDDAVKVLQSICQQIWKTQQWPQDWKRTVFILIPKKGNAKQCSKYFTIALISHAAAAAAKSLQSCPTLCDPMDCSQRGSSVHRMRRQECWSGLPCPPPGDLSDTGIKPASLMSAALAGRQDLYH